MEVQELQEFQEFQEFQELQVSLQVGGFWKASVSQRFPPWSRVTSHGKAAAHVSAWFASQARAHAHVHALSHISFMPETD